MKRTLYGLFLFWNLMVASSFVWNLTDAREEREAFARLTARSFFQQIVLARLWNANHGGVYVPVSSNTQPNPYLLDPMRDVIVNEELTLTKVNPAFMTRQLGEIAADKRGLRLHITSLNPLRPENNPTELEAAALKSFEEGVPEVGEFVDYDGEPGYFYMAALSTEAACLPCHRDQGYSLGDIRGGISVFLPFVPKLPFWSLAMGHLLIAMVGSGILIFLGMRLGRAYEETRRRSIRDGLTGIYNRRAFAQRLTREFMRNRRLGHTHPGRQNLSLIMVDVDHFKLYNDTHGHLKGDKCLQAVAAVLERALERPGDFCARFGGEEFVVLLPDTPGRGALHVAQRIRVAVEELKVAHSDSSGAGVLTISLGVATAAGDSPESEEELLRQADEALYLAKAQGRNRVAVHNS